MPLFKCQAARKTERGRTATNQSNICSEGGKRHRLNLADRTEHIPMLVPVCQYVTEDHIPQK